MGLKNMSILSGATITPSGGTAFVFADDGVTIPNGLHTIVPATVDARVRESITWRYKPSALQSDGTYSKDSKSMTFTVPILLASGKVVNQPVRVERNLHPEFSAANAVEINKKIALLMIHSDAAGFWATGSVN